MMARHRIAAGLCICATTLALSSGAWAQESDGYLAPAPTAADAAPTGNPAAPTGGYLRANDGGGYLGGGGSDGYFEDKAAPRTDTFVPATPESRETINGGALMLVAYTLFWLFTIAYVATLAVRAGAAQREVSELQNRIRELDERLEELESGHV